MMPVEDKRDKGQTSAVYRLVKILNCENLISPISRTFHVFASIDLFHELSRGFATNASLSTRISFLDVRSFILVKHYEALCVEILKGQNIIYETISLSIQLILPEG